MHDEPVNEYAQQTPHHPHGTADGADAPAEPRASTALTRITLNLTAPAARDLDALVATTGMNRTDAINRAIRLLAVLHPHLETGAVAITQPDGRHDRIYVL